MIGRAIKLNLLIIIAFFVSGCATNKTAEQLASNPKTFKYSFQSQLNYQKAYRILAEMSRHCLQGSAPGNKRRTEENLDTKAQIGEVRYINHNLFWGDDYFGYYAIKPVSGEKCEVTVYHPTTVIGHFDDQKIVQAWLDGSKKCPL